MEDYELFKEIGIEFPKDFVFTKEDWKDFFVTDMGLILQILSLQQGECLGIREVKEEAKNKIIQFPETEYILRCRKCGSNSFYVHLNSKQWNDIQRFECTECGQMTDYINKDKEK